MYLYLFYKLIVFLVCSTQTLRSGAPSGHSVRQYQLLGWPRDRFLPDPELSLLDLIEHAADWQRKEDSPDKIGQVIVQC